MKRSEISIPAFGGSSLLVTFGVLCLVVLAMLSLNTALSEQRLSKSYEEATQEWYASDLRAQEIFAELRAGEPVPEGYQYDFKVPISEHQVLEVALEYQNGSWEVISWRAVAYPAAAEDSLPVWKG